MQIAFPYVHTRLPHRWFSGDAGAGTLAATTCGHTPLGGDPVLSILASPTPSGPFYCLASNDDDFEACPGDANSFSASLRGVPFYPGTYYWWALRATCCVHLKACCARCARLLRGRARS